MADFSHLAQPAHEWLAYAAENPAVPPPAGLTLEEARDAFNRRREIQMRKFYGPNPDDVDVKEVTIPGHDGSTIQGRLYMPKEQQETHKLPLFVHLHSGGWHLGTLDTEDPFLAHFCSSFSRRPGSTGLAMLNINYRHTPEHCFPTQGNDVVAGLQYITSNLSNVCGNRIDTDQVVISGTSAGAHLAIGATLRALGSADGASSGEKPHIKPKGLILTCPPTVHMNRFPYQLMRNKDVQSYIQNAEAPLLPTSRCRTFWDLYVPKRNEAGGVNPETLAEVSPLLASNDKFDPKSWPPTSIHVAGMDCLRDEGLLFEAKVKDLGIETRLQTWPGLPHAFNMLPQLEASKKWREAIADDLVWLLGHK